MNICVVVDEQARSFSNFTSCSQDHIKTHLYLYMTTWWSLTKMLISLCKNNRKKRDGRRKVHERNNVSTNPNGYQPSHWGKAVVEVVEALQQTGFDALLPFSSLHRGNILAFCIPCGDCVLSYLACFFQIIIIKSFPEIEPSFWVEHLLPKLFMVLNPSDYFLEAAALFLSVLWSQPLCSINI